MRRTLLIAALLILMTALPLCAQHRGFGSGPRVGASVGLRHGRGVSVRGGFGFGHNPRFGVFFNPRPLHHHRFFSPFFHQRRFFSPYPFVYPAPIYPYYPLGYQSDFVYSGSAIQPAANYNLRRETALASDVDRLQAELDQIRAEQALRDQQQYADSALMQTPRPAAVRPEPPAPPTVLVFRDGRKQEVHNYAIAGQTLWIFSAERARKIPLAELDLGATRKANQERGVEFATRQ